MSEQCECMVFEKPKKEKRLKNTG